MDLRCLFHTTSYMLANLEMNDDYLYVGSSLCQFSLNNWLYMFALCSNIEDITRNAGSVDIEEDVFDSML